MKVEVWDSIHKAVCGNCNKNSDFRILVLHMSVCKFVNQRLLIYKHSCRF
jgi:hypothetical protein